MARRLPDLEGMPRTEPVTVSDFMHRVEASMSEPPVYNGDLFTAAEVEDFCRQYPRVQAVMLSMRRDGGMLSG